MVCWPPNAKLRKMVVPAGPQQEAGALELGAAQSTSLHGCPARISWADATGPRPSEVRLMTEGELNVSRSTWTIPAKRRSRGTTPRSRLDEPAARQPRRIGGRDAGEYKRGDNERVRCGRHGTQCLRISTWIQFGCPGFNGFVTLIAQKAAFANTL